MKAQQELARCEMSLSLLREERELLKDAEQRLLLERDSLQQDWRSQGLLHAQLESIKANLERAESETRARLEKSTTSLEQQCELLRKKLEQEEERFRRTVHSFEERLRMEQAAAGTAQERALRAEASAAKLQERLSAAESRSSMTSPIHKAQAMSRLLSTADAEPADETSSRLADAKAQAQALTEQLQLARQQAVQYRAIADAMEQELKKTNEASQAFRQELERHSTQVTQERDGLLDQVRSLTEALQAAQQQVGLLQQQVRPFVHCCSSAKCWLTVFFGGSRRWSRKSCCRNWKRPRASCVRRWTRWRRPRRPRRTRAASAWNKWARHRRPRKNTNASWFNTPLPSNRCPKILNPPNMFFTQIYQIFTLLSSPYYLQPFSSLPTFNS